MAEKSMTNRFEQMQHWLAGVEEKRQAQFSIPEPASNDASFRRYYRIRNSDTGESLIIMDAPPELEDSRPFVSVAQQLSGMGVCVPKIFEQDLAQGFLLLSDFGNTTFYSVLNEDNADNLYQSALSELVTIQTKGTQAANALPAYDDQLLQTEMSLFTDWLMERHLALSFNASQQRQWMHICHQLKQSALSQPQVFVHRDYHARNLMLLDNHQAGIIDFQDAVKGPLTYDAVSLLRDCYLTWPAEQITEWQRQYFLMLVEAKQVSKSEWQGFVKAMDWMGIQRHLKASGIFARLLYRDGKDGYMPDVPNTLNYLVQVAKNYPEMHFLADFVEDQMMSKL